MVSFTKIALLAVSATYVTASGMAEATVVTRNVTDCMTGYGAYSLDQLLLWDDEGSWNSLSEEISIGDACVPDAIATKLHDEMTSRGNALLASGDEVLGLAAHTGTQLAKRIRDCAQIRESAQTQVSAYSCFSASSPRKCAICEALATGILISACVACGAKNNAESIPCCITAAMIFTTYCVHTCLSQS
jgi:hypothetical protein